MDNLSKKDLRLVSLMLFSLFFGAGNLIFPPFLGQSAGSATWISMAGFFITAVGFPILGVIAVAKSGGLRNLAERVNPVFATIFTVLIYMSIGPCLGIPRAGSLPFEMAVAPFITGTDINMVFARFLYTLVFFSVAYWLCLSPSKLVDRIGKFLTPTLLTLIALVFVSSVFKPLGGYGVPTGEYASAPFVKGFLEGYLTMDTIAALNFGIVISFAIKSKGVKSEKAVVSCSIKAGVIAGALLVAVYSMLCHLGAASGGRFGATENGAQTLNNVMTYLFGEPGAVLLAVIFTVACLTTCVGLITSCSEYFETLNSKISYKTWVRILALSSMVLANMGLTKILAVSVPVLNAIYPIAIMLIVLAMLDKVFKGSRMVYTCTLLFTGIVSVVDALSQAGFNIEFLVNNFAKLPLYSQGLGWIVPAVAGILLGLVLCIIKKDRLQSKNIFTEEV
ncbi:branched-chain amino acid transport system II carrier protein [uncultured Clostridium sp.]|uniref:branched-chain amino acid transport system II carrier protein n=1 Tax=uncultured Clostridium sp. TaxID=59620 RepID=UPI0025FC1C75|nr:branched-chain amino acid transport system II carrier protein [uncultured Clostridium sp.]